MNHTPGMVIAGTHSGSGKTTITIGILAALKKKGLNVQAFKAGPDFIDPGFHRLITGRPSRNLDIWMCGKDYVMDCYKKHSSNVDISIIEGVMGLYDGGATSTAELAKTLGLPIILIVDAHGMAESVGAIVKGYVEFDRDTNIAGVIFNRVSGGRHFKMLVDAVKQSADHSRPRFAERGRGEQNTDYRLQILGYLPRNTSFKIPERHLGLVVAEEKPITSETVDKLADAIFRHIDVDRLISISNKLRVTSNELKNKKDSEDSSLVTRHSSLNKSLITHHASLRIAIALDEAFCFYYEDNLDLLKEAGAEIIKFSPLYDQSVPEADAIYIGGGYPELYAKELSGNASMLASIKDWANAGRPIYAECGGLMYLSKGIHDFNGNFSKMADVFPFETQMKIGRAHLGYREIELNDDCILGKKGYRLRGHEFHYSEIRNSAEAPKHRSAEGNVEGGVESILSTSAEIYSVRNNHGEVVNTAGYKFKNSLASYVHIHFGSNPDAAVNFVDFIKETSWKTSYS